MHHGLEENFGGFMTDKKTRPADVSEKQAALRGFDCICVLFDGDQLPQLFQHIVGAGKRDAAHPVTDAL